jgi:NAD/NADP transhydrogenase alpha subunit
LLPSGAGYPDAQYEQAGAKLVNSPAAALPKTTFVRQRHQRDERQSRAQSRGRGAWLQGGEN